MAPVVSSVCSQSQFWDSSSTPFSQFKRVTKCASPSSAVLSNYNKKQQCVCMKQNEEEMKIGKTKRREALLQTVFAAFSLPSIASTALAETDVQETTFGVYSDETKRFKIVIPKDWIVGEGESDGIRSLTAFYPEESTSSNVSVLISGLGADYTKLESFGKVDEFAETLVSGLDRSWQNPPGVAAKLINSKASNGLYYIEYSLQKPGESSRHIFSVLGMGSFGWYNKLYTDRAVFRRRVREIQIQDCQVEFQKAVSLLHSEDAGIKFRAVKKVANLAAKAKLIQEKSVEAWDMASLLMLLKSSENENTRGVAASAIANLAVNETNQKHIINQGGISLLSMTAADVEEPDHLFVVAAAIANLCGSAKFHTILSDKGGVKALLGMDKCGHQGVLAEVARGIANFAKCESRASTQGIITGRSILLDDGVLSWILQNAKNEASQIRGHIQLALCHLAQCEVNAKDMISGGALHELLHISLDCSEKDIKTLATQTLKSSPTFQSELQQLKD